MTIGCARCHDHKFDDIKQVDYYRWQACFAAILPNDDVSIASKQQAKEYQGKMQAWEKATQAHPRRHRFRIGRRTPGGPQDAIAAYDPQTKAAIETPPEKRSCLQKQLAAEAEEWIESRLERAYQTLPSR